MVGLYVEYKAKTAEIDAAFQKMQGQIDALKGKQKDVQTGFDQMSSSANKFGTVLQSALGRFIGFSAIVGGFRSVETATREYSAALADLSAITGATGRDLEYLDQSAKQLGQSSSSNAAQVAQAFKLVGSVKADLLDNLPALKQTTEQVILLSQAAGEDLALSAEVVGTSLNQFGAGSDQAARFVNVLAAGSREGAAELRDLGESLKYVGPIASQLGLSFEETVSMIELLSAAGIKGSEAGTGLRAAFIKMSSDANANFNPSIVGMTKALENLRKAQLTPTQLADKFGLVTVTSSAALIGLSKTLDTLIPKLTGSSAALDQSGARMAGYASKVDRLANAWYGLRIELGKTLENSPGLDALTKVLNGASGVLSSDSYMDKNDQILKNALQGNALESSIAAAPTKTDFILEQSKQLLQGIVPPTVDALGESFIKPIKSAGDLLTVFSETVSQANTRLQNSFESSGFADPGKGIANNLINKIASNDRQKFEAAGKNLEGSEFLNKTQEAAQLVRQILGTKDANQRSAMTDKLNRLQEDLNYEAYAQGSSFGSTAVGTRNGGTFSALGSQSDEETKAIQKSIVENLNKFVSQQLDKSKQINVQVTIEASNDFVTKVASDAAMTKVISQQIDDISSQAASASAK